MSFLNVLRGRTGKHRDYVYGVHNNVPEGPSDPIRAISDGRYRYIRNLRSDEIYIEKHLMGVQGDGALNNPYWSTWVFQSWQNQHTYDMVKRYVRRPAEELYHTTEDPYEMENLAQNTAHAELKARLSAELDRWMWAQGDPGAPEDTVEALQAARRGEHLYGPGRRAAAGRD